MGRTTKRGGGDAQAWLRLERLLWDLGFTSVAGVDEVGLGPLAGPVVAAAVVFPPGSEPLDVADSKTLSPARREALDVAIRDRAAALAVGVVGVADLDEMGVHEAGVEAMRRAVTSLDPPADYLLVDARRVPGVDVGQSAYVKGDSFIHGVAAASIVAKVYRDRIMVKMDRRYPGYGFSRHMGYGTAAHMNALGRLGPCEIHRRSFAPVRRSAEARGEEAG